MKKGFINILAIATIAAIISAASFGYSIYKVREANLGATIISTNLTDTIGTFRTNVNTSLTNINNALSNATSGDPGHYHTLSNDASATGTLTIAKGGTGTSTAPTNGQFFTASGTIPTWKILTGTGIIITHTSTSTNFATTGVDEAANYNWTGQHTFGSIPTLPATDPTTDNQASRKSYVDDRIFQTGSNITLSGTSTTAEVTIATSTIPANTLGINGRMRIFISGWAGGLSGAETATFNIKFGGTTIATAEITNGAAYTVNGFMVNRNSTSSQITTLFIQDTNTNEIQTANTSSINTGVDQYLTITGQKSAAAGPGIPQIYFYVLEILKDL